MKLLITISTAALLAGCSTVPISVPVKNNHTADVKVIKQAVIPVQWQAPHQAGTLQRKLAQSIEWAQVDPNYLWFTPLNEPRRLITRGGAGHNAAAARMTRIPAGHPEGYLEGFANIYGEAALAIRALRRVKVYLRKCSIRRCRMGCWGCDLLMLVCVRLRRVRLG